MSSWFCGPESLFGFHFGGFFHIIFWLACLMLLFTLFCTLFAKKQINTATTGNKSSALSFLEERYASGEIHKKSFY
jgi:uncharacterized membrane protein